MSQRVRVSCPSVDHADYFAPPGDPAMEFPPVLKAFLAKMGEPSLSCGGDDAEAYRVILAGGSNVQVVRVTNRGQVADVTRTRLSLSSNEIVEHTQGRLALGTWNTIVEAVEHAGLWSLPGIVRDTTDGAVLWEGRRGNRYRAVNGIGHGLPVEPVVAVARQFVELRSTE
jgi:hypothetical protein